MKNLTFIFFFYEVKNPWTGVNRISQCLRVEPSSEDRYSKYFLSFWFEFPDFAHSQQALLQLDALEKGEIPEIFLGGDEWIIHATLDKVIFADTQIEEWNDGTNNIFGYEEFKTILTAWNRFLALPSESAGSEYVFVLPEVGTDVVLTRREKGM